MLDFRHASTLIFVILIAACASMPDGYHLEGNEVRYVYRDFKSNTWINKAIPADAATFQSFEDGFHLAKDKNHVFKRGEIWDAFDAPSFEVLSDFYYSDKNGLYYKAKLIDQHEQLDRATFIAPSPNWAGDANTAMYKGQRLDLCDRATFVFPPESDPPSAIANPYAYDAKCVYHVFTIGYTLVSRLTEDRENFTVLSQFYAKDSASVYNRGRLIAAADPATFEVIGNRYARDAKQAFYTGRLIPAADVETFETLEPLESLSRGYARDKRHVYKSGQIIEGADVATFEIVPRPKSGPYPYDSRDAFRTYKFGKPVSP